MTQVTTRVKYETAQTCIISLFSIVNVFLQLVFNANSSSQDISSGVPSYDDVGVFVVYRSSVQSTVCLMIILLRFLLMLMLMYLLYIDLVFKVLFV